MHKKGDIGWETIAVSVKLPLEIGRHKVLRTLALFPSVFRLRRLNSSKGDIGWETIAVLLIALATLVVLLVLSSTLRAKMIEIIQNLKTGLR